MYLTTVIELLRAADLPVAAEIAADTASTFGINDRIQLAEAGRVLNDRIVRHWQREGVTVIDPATTWIDDDASLAPDVTILPNTHILRATTIAEGANDPWQLSQLERAFQLRAVRALCAQGVRFADPARVDIRGTVAAGRDVEIDVDVVLEGEVALGDNVRIGPFCRLRDVALAAGTLVRAHCDLEGARTEGAATIGPFARLRPGTVLADGVHVGNFVETKNAVLGAGSKANHLSYLGDAVVGSKVNIGAGTITCNYDGVNKATTRIEDGAFIGSNSALVAPVTIGRDATIGAGSVITKRAPDGKLTIARGRQETLPGWQRPRKK
jgi:bifunctional UDP-N-acetylglucosamine pyrophosphorylase/glucosamine-1-phosphate N-acetyltransferase